MTANVPPVSRKLSKKKRKAKNKETQATEYEGLHTSDKKVLFTAASRRGKVAFTHIHT